MCIDYMYGTFYALQKYVIKKSEIEDILERIAL